MRSGPAIAAAAWAEHAARTNAAAAITTDAVKHHVEVLADDTFEGREAGSRGGRAAGLYIVKQIEAAGIPGGGDKGSYYQPFGSGYSNILAMLAGSDPALKDQVIVVSAHYDHVGYGTRRNSYRPDRADPQRRRRQRQRRGAAARGDRRLQPARPGAQAIDAVRLLGRRGKGTAGIDPLGRATDRSLGSRGAEHQRRHGRPRRAAASSRSMARAPRRACGDCSAPRTKTRG